MFQPEKDGLMNILLHFLGFPVEGKLLSSDVEFESFVCNCLSVCGKKHALLFLDVTVTFKSAIIIKWLRLFATSRNVAVSRLDEVNKFVQFI